MVEMGWIEVIVSQGGKAMKPLVNNPPHRPFGALLRALVLIVGGLLVAGPSPSLAAGSAGELPEKVPADKTHDVQLIQDVTYYEGPETEKVAHQLDLYLPKGATGFPVLFFVHGGAWIQGEKSLFGLHKPVGMFWASRGVGVVMINYRLSPTVIHPEHIKDVARAFAWTVSNIHKYGGRPDEVFLFGHSAGGHLVALLATDDSYLKAEDLTLGAIKGVILMSGVYHLPMNNPLLDSVFGTEAKVRKEASPLSHVRADAPPFLILYAEHDLSLCGKRPSEEFCKALLAKKAVAQALEMKERNHVTLFFKAAAADDPAVEVMWKFLRAHTGEK
jgi:arylformamidase